MYLKMTNFLDFDPKELIRTITVVIDLQLTTAGMGTIPNSNGWIQIGALWSDIEIALLLKSDPTAVPPVYEFQLAYRKNDN